jgi:hypothetical protein
MINHIWTVLCSKSITDQESNNISLLEVLEQLTIVGPPIPSVVPVRFEVVTLWGRSDADQPSRGHARLLFLTPSDTVIGEHEYDIDLSVYQRYRTRTVMTGLPVQEAGRHHFRVQLRDEGETEWRDVANIPLQVLLETSEG